MDDIGIIGMPSVDIDRMPSVDIDSMPFIDVNDISVLPIKRPYLINLNNVEFIEGDWNEDRTEYGIRIGYVSGHTKCFWGETAHKVLEALAPYDCDEKNRVVDKFDDRMKDGPPAL